MERAATAILTRVEGVGSPAHSDIVVVWLSSPRRPEEVEGT